MSESKNSFVLYNNYFEILKDLSDSDAGILFKAILQYQATKTIPEMPINVSMAFKFIKNQFDIDEKKYNDFCEKQKANGFLGGRPKKKNNPKNPTVFSETQKSLNENDNENENEDEDEDEKIPPKIPQEDEKKAGKGNIDIKPKIDPYADPLIDKCFDIYRENCKNLSILGFEPRNRQIREDLSEFLTEINEDIGYFEEVCKKANELKSICNTKIDFKMLIKNHIGIYNGKYNSNDVFSYEEYLKNNGNDTG